MNATPDSEKWKWMQEESPTGWADSSIPKIANGTRPRTPIVNTNGRNKNFYKTLYRSQHVDNEMRDVINGQLQFGISRVLNQAIVPLNWEIILEQFQHCMCARPVSAKCTAK